MDEFSAVLHQRTVAGELDLAVLYEGRTIGPLATTPLIAEHLLLVRRLHRQPTAAVRTVEAEIRALAHARAGALQWRPLTEQTDT